MPIKWSALMVCEAADMIEEFITRAAEPLEQVRLVAEQAREIDNLPQYVDQHFVRIIGEIDRAIGGSQFEPVGRLRAGIEAVRNSLPSKAVEADQKRAKQGNTLALM